ncbi:MAG: hypothetical protein V4812_17755 [Pseudomonadota bacterium]
MQRRTCKFLILALLVGMTNGFSLLGIGNASAGALARTLECNANLTRNSEVAAMFKHLAGSPPCKKPGASAQTWPSCGAPGYSTSRARPAAQAPRLQLI